MRIFQIIHRYDPYIPYFEKKYGTKDHMLSFSELKKNLLRDRFYSPHILKPVLEDYTESFYTMWNYPQLQLKWAEEKGWKENNLKKILSAQIEEFKPDVFYSCSPIHFTSGEIKKMPYSDRMIRIAWFASPENKKIDFSVYHTRLTNYPPDVENSNKKGYRSDIFQPAVDSKMAEIGNNQDKETDILFYGQYFPDYFKTRNKYIDKLITLKEQFKWNVRICILYRLEYGSMLPGIIPRKVRNSRYGRYFRSHDKIVFPDEQVRNNTESPLYGLDLYAEIAKSKIVFNAAVDFSGNYKVNMRIFETLGCGTHMLSDDGIYPDGLQKGIDFSVYRSFDEFVELAKYYLEYPGESKKIALAGFDKVHKHFSKEIQWEKFRKIVESL